ncbi:hypothetical protein BD410DRAFT_130050 [Rickenella mellea]|uniref:RING-type domain-containing protein n=1 Tax=Rickenella mellea TaxID=50990 RepID=A0A4Y7Q923_9AGAM|nr:hypothetical protein BD410DRAFT_130050 [Rickenella mellea]
MPRRSTRLNGDATTVEFQPEHDDALLSIAKKKRRIEKQDLPGIDNGDGDSCGEADLRDDGESSVVPITSAELSKRELDVIRRERELRMQMDQLAKQQLDLARAEELLSERTAEVALAQLEDHFQCPLCFEVIACPYILTPAQCGHTFCALCTARWFFSRLHKGCGGWHESVDCPMCRALLILTPDTTPRSTITVPFAPNRMADVVLCELVRKLGSREPRKTGEGDVAEKITEPPAGLDAWANGGTLQLDWLERDRIGRREMDDIIGRWKGLEGADFIEIKSRLGV